MKLHIIITIIFICLFFKSEAQNDTLFYNQSEMQLHYDIKNLFSVKILRLVADSLNIEFELVNRSNAKIALNENIEMEEDVDTCNVYIGYIPLSDHESFTYPTVIIYPNEKYNFALSKRRTFYKYSISTLVSMNADEIIKNAQKQSIKADMRNIIKKVQRSSDDGIFMTPFIEIFIKNISNASPRTRITMYSRVRK